MANYIGIVIGFFTTFFVLTDCLSQEEIGLTRIMVDVAMLFSALAQLGTNASIIRFFPYFNSPGNKHHGIFGWALLVPCIGFIAISTLLFVFRHPIEALYSEKSPLLTHYFYLLIPLTFFALYQTVFETCASVLLRITIPKLVREVGIRLCTLICYLLYGYHVISLDLFVVLFCGCYGLAMLLNFVYLISLGHISFRIERGFIDKRLGRDIIRYTLVMTLTAIASNIPIINTLFLGAEKGLALTGVYTIALYISNIVEVPYRSLGAISRPLVAKSVKEADWNEVNRMGRQLSVHQFLVSTLLLFFISINLPTLYALIPNGQDYAAGISVVLIMGIAKVINSSFSVNTDVLSYSRHFFLSFPFMLLLTVSAILFNRWLIPLWGINGAATATLFSYLLYYLPLILFVMGKMHVNTFSTRHLKIMLLLGTLIVLHWIWTLLTPDGTTMLRMICRSLIESGFLLAVATTAVYLLRISPNVNELIERYLPIPSRLKKKQ